MRFRLLLLASTALAAPLAGAQDAPSERWYHLDAERDGIRGIGLDRAYEALAGRAPQRSVVVAVIDGGVDVTHEDLQGRLWTNPGETPGNGLDDDGNGYADDVHGWNFIGGADGRNVDTDTYELTREVARYRRMAAGGAALSAEDRDRAARLEAELETRRRENAESLANLRDIDELVTAAENVLRTHFGHDRYTPEQVEAIRTDDTVLDQARRIMGFLAMQGATPQQLHDEVARIEGLQERGLNPDFDPRAVVGDDYADLDERAYGNADVRGPRPGHGTAVAGVIAAVRANGRGIDGVADSVRIMAIRVVPDGDERDKDVANGIRYAVDNGAQVINMSFGKPYSPGKSAVDEAVRYAESRGVLLVHAAGNAGADIDTSDNFPSRLYTDGVQASNWLEIGASTFTDALAAEFSNYGATRVDLFAPGARITTLAPDGEVQTTDGTSLAAPVVSGVAALLLSHYPELTPIQVRQLLLDSARRLPETEVPRPGSDERVVFGALSSTGGLLDAAAAVAAAAAMAQ